MDEEFLDKVDTLFMDLTRAILCHSVRRWRTGNFINNITLRCASSKGKTNKTDLGIS